MIFCFGSVLATACGSADSNVASGSQNSNQTVRFAQPSSAINSDSAGQNTNFSTQNANTANNSRVQQLEQMRAAANKPGQKVASLNSRPGPEDSTLTSTLTDVARETRVWNKHPTLAKVEKIHDGAEGSIKVYLKNGKVFDLPGKSIEQLYSVPAATVLSLVGVATSTNGETKRVTHLDPKKPGN